MAETVLKTIIQVRRDTTANWLTNKAVVPAAGEPCLDTDTGVVVYGNGVATYETLLAAYEANKAVMANHYEGVKQSGESDNDVIERVLTELETTAKKDDIFVVKSLISTGKYSYTAFVYTGSAWAAMDGNYNAGNVYFDRDLLTTVATGNITLTNGQATVPATGKNLYELWETINVKEDTDISVTKPSVSVSGSVKYIEVGGSSSQDVTVTYEDGSYEYGYTTETGEAGDNANNTVNNGTTGANVTGYILTDGSNAIEPKTSGGNTFTVDSGIKTAKASMTVKGSATYDDGYIPVSNLKKMYPAKKITAGTTAEVPKELFRWYVPMFYGFKYGSALINDPANISEAEIKALSIVKDATAYNQTKPASATATGSWKQFFVAVPAGYNAELSGISDSNKLPLTIGKATNVTMTFGTASIEYEIWYVALDADYDTKALTLTW